MIISVELVMLMQEILGHSCPSVDPHGSREVFQNFVGVAPLENKQNNNTHRHKQKQNN